MSKLRKDRGFKDPNMKRISIYCSKISENVSACQYFDTKTNQMIVTHFDYDPTTNSLSYEGLTFRPTIRMDIYNGSPSTKSLHWIAGLVLNKQGIFIIIFLILS